MTTGEAAAIATVLCSVLTMLGVTGIDSGMVSGAITGVISLIGIASGLLAWYHHKQAVVAAGLRE